MSNLLSIRRLKVMGKKIKIDGDDEMKEITRAERLFNILQDNLPKSTKIDYENVNKIFFDRIVAFTFETTKAMGDYEKITIVSKDKELIFYEIGKVFNKDNKLIEIMDSTFFKPIAGQLKKAGYLSNIDGFIKYNLGHGNSYFIRSEYKKDFDNFLHVANFNSSALQADIFPMLMQATNIFFNDKLLDIKNDIIDNSPDIMGAVIGDIIGSRFEFHPIKTKNFELFSENKNITKDGKLTLGYFNEGSRFTDDSVMTLAIYKALVECKGNFQNLQQLTVENMQELGRKFPLAGYGNNFNRWLMLPVAEPYNSFGNGSAMRVSPVAYFATSIDELKEFSKLVTEVTHNHEEGLKGAEAVAISVWMALYGYTKEEIREKIEKEYYNLDFNYEELVKSYSFDETCQGSVPQAIYAFLISNSFEDAIRTSVSMGGDADTMSAIAGAIAGAYYGIPKELKEEAKKFLTNDLLEIIAN